jgi:hypothetical protein
MRQILMQLHEYYSLHVEKLPEVGWYEYLFMHELQYGCCHCAHSMFHAMELYHNNPGPQCWAQFPAFQHNFTIPEYGGNYEVAKELLQVRVDILFALLEGTEPKYQIITE